MAARGGPAGALVPAGGGGSGAGGGGSGAAGGPGGGGAAAPAPRVARVGAGAVPPEVAEDPALLAALEALPANYALEVPKAVWRCRRDGVRRVALQFPEGLLLFACAIADILREHAGVRDAVVLGDVTYGACCVEDLQARALGCDLLIHYGHSCLVPVPRSAVPCMYVFVDIQVDAAHLEATFRQHFPPGARVAVAGVVQFNASVQKLKASVAGDYALDVPQSKPLSVGEVLGCTAPRLPGAAGCCSSSSGAGGGCGGQGGDEAGGWDGIFFVADGRFHLEAMMIANPGVPAFRYDPYSRELTRERYDHQGMRAARRAAIERAREARHWGVVLGTLGRQGNPALLRRIEARLQERGIAHTVVLLAEVTLERLALFEGVDAWVQICCPRLSIDWGEGFGGVPLLTPYEAFCALGAATPFFAEGAPDGGAYPMDYYSAEPGGDWGSTYMKRRKPRAARAGGGEVSGSASVLARDRVPA